MCREREREREKGVEHTRTGRERLPPADWRRQSRGARGAASAHGHSATHPKVARALLPLLHLAPLHVDRNVATRHIVAPLAQHALRSGNRKLLLTLRKRVDALLSDGSLLRLGDFLVEPALALDPRAALLIPRRLLLRGVRAQRRGAL